MNKILDCCRKINYLSRNISVTSPLFQDTKVSKRKVKETVELITLVDQNDKILGLKPKTESEKLARKLNLTLERVHDLKYGKIYPAYKMVSSSALLKTEIKTTQVKVLKKLPINHRISDHDLSNKLQIVRRWLVKNYEVHVAVLGSSEVESLKKSILEKIQEELKDECRIIDVRNKDNSLNFIILPPKVQKVPIKENKSQEDTSNSDSK